LCPTGAALTSPGSSGAASQPANPQRFFHHVAGKMAEKKRSPRASTSFSMRTVLLGLALLAGLKIWFQDRTYRVAMADAVIEAYRERAVEVCRRSAARRAASGGNDGVAAWNAVAPARAEAVIGNPEIGVAIWDMNNPLWEQRYRDLHLVLTAGSGGTQRCSYDVRQGGATFMASVR
jgi:hypothetical protein